MCVCGGGCVGVCVYVCNGVWGGVCGAGCVGVGVCVCAGVCWCVRGGVCGWGCLWVCVGGGVCVCVCAFHFSTVSFRVTCNAANVKISEFPLPERHASIEMHRIICDRDTNK